MRTNINEIKRMLADRAQSVCEYLLPNGRTASGEWCVGSLGGEPGKSLKVCLRGNKAGVWSDFATGDSGDLIDLWKEVQKKTVVEALQDIRGWLGVETPFYTRPVSERPLVRPPKPVCSAPRNRVRDYLVEDRNIPGEVLGAYKIGEQMNYIVFPFLRGGELIMVKTRLAEDGAKPVPTAPGCEKILFGWQAVDDNTREIYITEGEIDAMSMAAYSYPAVSVPFGGGGGGKQDWIESEYEHLDRFETIYLCLDNDPEGKAAVEEISRRLGRHRCRVVTLPYKDANECLQRGVRKAEIDEAIAAAVTLDPETLTRVIDYGPSVVGLLWPEEGRHLGYSFRYRSLTDKVIFRPGEVTIWTGASGHGKSQILSDCIVYWIKEGSRVCLASLEMAPPQTLKRMVKQTSGTDRPTEEYIHQCLAWLDPGLVVYNRVGKASIEEMLEAFEYAAAKYGCDQFVIDSLMRLGIESDDYNGQEQVMYRVVDWAIDRVVHVHFVAHARKGDRGAGPQEIEDVKGAMEIGANAFNVISIWRDKNWENLRERAESDEDLSEDEQRYLDAGGVVVNVSKQRNGDWTGRVRLHFNIENYQYRSNQCPQGHYHYVDLEQKNAGHSGSG